MMAGLSIINYGSLCSDGCSSAILPPINLNSVAYLSAPSFLFSAEEVFVGGLLEVVAGQVIAHPPLLDPLVRTFRHDVEFPDLYFFNQSDNLQLYRDYLGKKIARMGYNPEDLSPIDPNDPNTNSTTIEAPIDYSNTVFHQGKK